MPKTKTDKKTILKKAIELFSQNGYHATKFSELSKVCNIEKAHFYYYFKNKEELMCEVLKFASVFVKEKLLSPAYDPRLSPLEKISDIADRIYTFHMDKNYGCFMGNIVLETAHDENAFKPILKEYFEYWIKTLQSIYQEKMTGTKAEQCAVTDYQRLQGAVMFMKLYNDKKYLKEALYKMVQRVE